MKKSVNDDFPALRAKAPHVGSIASRQGPGQGRLHQVGPSTRPPGSMMYKGQSHGRSHASSGMHTGSHGSSMPPHHGTASYPNHPALASGFSSGVALGSSANGPAKLEFGDARKDRENFGLLGILKVIRMTDPDLNTLALGMDLTTLGLNLNSPECLYTTFASPWSELPARKDPEYYLPPCYYMQPPQLKSVHLKKFTLETLCYIFHHMPGDMLQAYVSQELYSRKWFFHSELKFWFEKSDDPSKAPWSYFDPEQWEKRDYWEQLDESKFLSEADVRIQRDGGPSK